MLAERIERQLEQASLNVGPSDASRYLDTRRILEWLRTRQHKSDAVTVSRASVLKTMETIRELADGWRHGTYDLGRSAQTPKLPSHVD